ncbi:hypothetical protein SB00610_03016 [Klebsiella quasipneumoniae subsp. similipneumoniae]|nr:hypothetical protein SB00610_03016 [Klebsiella quasipneumoniae subsp. similipneumoniae]
MAAGSKLLGLLQLTAQHKNERHDQAAKKERNTPSPVADGALLQYGVEGKAHRGRHHDGDLLAARLPAGVKPFAARGGDLGQIDGYPAQFSAGGEALQQTADQHQQRRPQANGLVRGDQHDQEGAGGHDRQGHNQPFAPPYLVDIGAKHDGADGPHQKAGAKDRKGHHQRGEFTAGRKKGMCDVGGIKPEQEKVELFEKVTGRDAQNGAEPITGTHQ